MSLTRLARRKSFQCLHRYNVDQWTSEQNQQNFGACFTPTGHGHNYEVEAHFEGPIDPVSGMILNLVDADLILQKVVGPLDGKHLNFEVPEFKNKVPTTEALATFLAAEIQRTLDIPGVKLAKLRLYEYDDLWVDVWP